MSLQSQIWDIWSFSEFRYFSVYNYPYTTIPHTYHPWWLPSGSRSGLFSRDRHRLLQCIKGPIHSVALRLSIYPPFRTPISNVTTTTTTPHLQKGAPSLVYVISLVILRDTSSIFSVYFISRLFVDISSYWYRVTVNTFKNFYMCNCCFM